MVESGLGGRFWFKAATAGKDARNDVYKERIKTSPHHAMYEEPKIFPDLERLGGKPLFI